MKKLAIAAALTFGAALPLAADEEADFILNGETEMTIRAPAPEHMENVSEIFSGWVFRSDETQALQTDDFDNPGMIWVDSARENWAEVDGTAGESCASCHGEPEEMAGVRPVYPKWNEDAGELRTLEMQVNACREENMGAEPWKYTGGEMTNMISLLASVSRGMPVNVAIDGPVADIWEQGKEIYYTRFGQLELSCANCHEDNYGNYIRADHLSQGQINGFPTYRLKNAKLNTVQDRFRGCVRDTRGQTFDVASPEFIALELYVASRGNGLSVEGPSVRN